MRPFTPEQTQAFLRALEGDRHDVLFHLLLGTGMRPGEALGLQCPVVDWANCSVRVEQTLVRIFGQGGG